MQRSHARARLRLPPATDPWHRGDHGGIHRLQAEHGWVEEIDQRCGDHCGIAVAHRDQVPADAEVIAFGAQQDRTDGRVGSDGLDCGGEPPRERHVERVARAGTVQDDRRRLAVALDADPAGRAGFLSPCPATRRGRHARSKTAAIPCPPPMHMVTSA
jgi:hypothetical protein